jgi:hypothetical protein
MLGFELLGPPTKVCSPECVEGEFCELRHNGVLGSSRASFVLWSTYCAIAQNLP